MIVPRTFEQNLLADAEAALDDAVGQHGAEARIVVLEGLASRVGQWSLAHFRRAFGRSRPTDKEAAPFVERLMTALASVGIHPALAISALSHPEASRESRRSVGAYYTDHRLAEFAGGLLAATHAAGEVVLDPACGSGILLVAYVLAASAGDEARRVNLVRDAICGADLDARALRCARAALAALCTDVSSIAHLATRLRQHDSLIVGMDGWADIAPQGFAAVIGNPPWEKIKVSRHEFLRTNGHDRHYGDEYTPGTATPLGLRDARESRSAYGREVEARLPLSHGGELDLYKAFTAASIASLRPGGRLSLIVPAGLIRSQGTEALRRHLLATSGSVEVTILDNKARHFAIDTRFKFLVLSAQKGGRERPIRIRHAYCNDRGIKHSSGAELERALLAEARPDLTLPEVRSEHDWRVLLGMHRRGQYMDAPGSTFQASIVREVDMTRDRAGFARSPGSAHLPLVEGRMVAQHRFGAKTYATGTGRRARWQTVPAGASHVVPQFFYPSDRLSAGVADLTRRVRVGFCDVTGQTNERSIIACRVPAGVACGNKVPTITFAGDEHFDISWLFLAVANSFPFDWFARRVLTTSVNYFILRSIPLPVIPPSSPAGRRLVELARKLAVKDEAGAALNFKGLWQTAVWRAEIEALVASAWGLTVSDVESMLDDFPLLDRGQPSPSGVRSTVTRDLVLSTVARQEGQPDAWHDAVRAAQNAGAVPFMPSEYVSAEHEDG